MRSTSAKQEDIAIIGLSGLFPGCRDKEAFWSNIVGKIDNIKVAPDAWAKPWYDPELAGKTLDSGRIRTRKVGLLGDLAVFDPLEFGIPPKAVEGDPAHFLALRLANDALKDAHYDNRPFNRVTTGIIIGHGSNPNRGDTIGLQYSFAIEQTIEVFAQLFPQLSEATLEKIRAALKTNLPAMQIEQAPSLISNVISGRIANRLDLMGPNHMVDAACSSSLIAVDLAAKELREGRSDMMLVGGVQASMPAQIYMLFETLGTLSPSSIRPFDEAANGTLLSEGVGFVVLKRLADAVRDSDKIYAVIKGVGVASDGKATGLLAPRLEGEVLALQRAYGQTGIDPLTVGLIEAHGTGIPLGDRLEIQALTKVFGERGGGFPRCALGAVKSMIGHCIPAAGVASLIKTSLALYYKTLPPTLCDTVNPALELDKTPFYVNTEVRPWTHGGDLPRRAGIDAFGFGGINTHAILEEFRDPVSSPVFSIGQWLVDNTPTSAPAVTRPIIDRGDSRVTHPRDGCANPTWSRWPTELLIFSGHSRDETMNLARNTLELLQTQPDKSLASLAYAQCLSCGLGDVRLAIVAASCGDLSEKLEFALKKLGQSQRTKWGSRKGVYYSEEGKADSKLVFLFSSEGAQYSNMLADLCLYLPKVGRWFDFLDEIFPRFPKPSDCIFPPPSCLNDSERELASQQLFAGDLATESVSTASQAVYEILRDLGVRCDVMAGHSAGEHTALRAAGKARTKSLQHLKEEMRLLNKVYGEINSGSGLPTGKVLSVGALALEKVMRILEEFQDSLYLVSDNCPSQVILFANETASQAAIDRIRAEGGICVELPFDRAYHTPLFRDAMEVLRRYYEKEIEANPNSVTVYSCSTAQPYPENDAAACLEIAAQQWVKPVRFRETIEQLYRDGARIFVELGASNSLTAFVDSILKGKDYLAVAANVQGKPALEQFQHMLAQLYVNHVDMDMTPMYDHRDVAWSVQDPTGGQEKSGLSIVLSSALPRLSLDPSILAELRDEIAPVPRSDTLGVSRVDTAEPPYAGDHEEILARHFALMQEFLENQARISELFGDHLRNLQKED